MDIPIIYSFVLMSAWEDVEDVMCLDDMWCYVSCVHSWMYVDDYSQVILSLSTQRRNREGVDVQLHSFLTSALDGVE
jgi:hypothetical protein